MRTYETRTCAHCGLPFERYVAPSREGRGIYCSRTCKYAHLHFVLGVDHPCWKGGHPLQLGYLMRYAPDDPHVTAAQGRYAREHRIVASQKIGRPLYSNEIVHHVNGDRTDNRPDNLEVMTQSAHMKLHWAEKKAAVA